MLKIIKYSEDTFARLGVLRIKNKKIKTPILWLGQIINGSPKIWEYFNVKSLIVNACDILNHKKAYMEIKEKGIFNYLGYNKENFLMMDSGGFLFQKKKILNIKPQKILDLYHSSNPDLSVVLDHPLNPNYPLEGVINKNRWKKTYQNSIYMEKNNGSIALMPVLHGYTLKQLKKACKQIKAKIQNLDFIGLGSLVPLLRTSNGIKKFSPTARHYIIDAIKLVRKEFPESFLHVFGIGGATTMHLMFSLGIDSIDSMAWRLKAAHGAIQLPGISDRFLKTTKNRRMINNKEKAILNKCSCPICKNLKLKDKLIELRDSFESRAIHNAWVFMEEGKKFKNAVLEDKIGNFIKRRLKNKLFYKLYEYSKRDFN